MAKNKNKNNNPGFQSEGSLSRNEANNTMNQSDKMSNKKGGGASKNKASGNAQDSYK